MNRNLLLILLFLWLSACTSQDQDTSPTDVQTFETNSGLKISSGRYTKNVVDKLYQEALNENESLKSLDQDINNWWEYQGENLQDFNEFVSNNENYWFGVEEYINQMEDTILQEKTRAIFNAAQQTYHQRIANHANIKRNIELKNTILQDQHVLMKLIVTLQMMDVYQQNKLPAIAPLENVENMLDVLLDSTKNYTSLK